MFGITSRAINDSGLRCQCKGHCANSYRFFNAMYYTINPCRVDFKTGKLVEIKTGMA